MPPHLLTRDDETAAVDFLKYPDAYNWPAAKIFSEGRTEMLELCLQEDPSIGSYRHNMTRALKDANLGIIKSLLRGGAKLLKTEIDATNALYGACRRRNQDVVKVLLSLGADANSRLFRDERGRTPLYEASMIDSPASHGHRGHCINCACSCSSLDTMQLLLDHGANPNAKRIGGETMLHKALGLGEAHVRLLLSRGADVEAINDQQDSILDLAIHASVQMINILVEYGINLEARDVNGQTALLKAVQKESEDGARVETLIRHAANVHAKDFAGKTVLHHFCGSSDGTLRRFLELGVDVSARDHDGATALGLAVRQNDDAKLKMLLEFGAVFGAESKPPLVEAAAHGNKDVVNMLLRMGSDPNLLGKSEMSAVSSAARNKNKEIVTALLEAGADPNLVDKSNVTPLTRAITNKDKEIGEVLIQAGAAIQPPDPIPFGPLHIAIKSGDVHMVEFLIQQGADVSSHVTQILCIRIVKLTIKHALRVCVLLFEIHYRTCMDRASGEKEVYGFKLQMAVLVMEIGVRPRPILSLLLPRLGLS